jgi:hypothetical protein
LIPLFDQQGDEQNDCSERERGDTDPHVGTYRDAGSPDRGGQKSDASPNATRARATAANGFAFSGGRHIFFLSWWW